MHSSPTDDDELAALTLQLEELTTYHQTSKGKFAAERPPDGELAYRLMEEELREYPVFLQDRRIARSMGAAVDADGKVVAELTAGEVMACEDRRIALERSEGGHGEGKARAEDGRVEEWLRVARGSQCAGSVVGFFESDEDDEEGGGAGPSRSYAERQADALEQLGREVMCVACREVLAIGRSVTVPCGDKYCVECLRQRFILAIKDETLLPVRCHKTAIPLELVSGLLSDDERTAFERALLEFETVDRVYCSDRACGRFIPPGRVEPGSNKASCEACSALTCGICKSGFHPDSDCPEDLALRSTRELADSMGWKPCYRCRSVVILRTGCNHMTCRCKAEFCYECGAKWKTCDCQYAQEDRMLERAAEIVDRDRDATIDLSAGERRRRVQQVHDELMENHECDHPGRFRKIDGGRRSRFQCEICDAVHRKFILQCRHCPIRLCQECRCNRI